MTITQKISAILATDESYEICRRTIHCLLNQTVLNQIELVIVCPSCQQLNPDMHEVKQFGSYQIVETGVALSTGQMLAEGIRAANTEAVMYFEEHNFPPPETAAVAIRELVENGRPAVGFPMLPANPGLVAWAHMYGQFGPVVAPVEAGIVRRFGGHHAAYRKSFLMQYDANLIDIMDNEAVLHEDMEERGVEMYLVSDVVIPHVQISNFGTYVRHEFLAQRIFATARARVLNWSLARRLLYTIGAPLIPLTRLLRSLGHIRRTSRTAELLPQIIPVMLCANVFGAIGEAVGYILGANALSNSNRMEIELDRYAFVNKKDRARAIQASSVNGDRP